jgi:hypothetical protein
MIEVKCPHCGSTDIIEDDVMDKYVEENKQGDEVVVEEVFGVCGECDHSLRWQRVYSLYEVRNIEEIREWDEAED